MTTKDTTLPQAVAIPEVLFDGNAVYAEMSVQAHARTSAINVADVLDAVVRLMRAAPTAQPQADGVKP